MQAMDEQTATKYLIERLAAEGFTGEKVEKRAKEMYPSLRFYRENGVKYPGEISMLVALLPEESELSKRADRIAYEHDVLGRYTVDECLDRIEAIVFGGD